MEEESLGCCYPSHQDHGAVRPWRDRGRRRVRGRQLARGGVRRPAGGVRVPADQCWGAA